MSEPLVRLDGVIKDYGEEVVTRVLHGVDLEVGQGEFVALVGRSGSGKSTLLNILGLLDRATAGEVWIAGQRVGALGEAGLTAVRAHTLGFIFQFHHLIGALSVRENVMIPLAARVGRLKRAHRARAQEALDAVGLGDRAEDWPRRLSGGEQQRVAIARALAGEPPLILADEPTGNLDSTTADEVFDLLRKTTRERGTAVIMVTHDRGLAARCDRIVELLDGRIAGS